MVTVYTGSKGLNYTCVCVCVLLPQYSIGNLSIKALFLECSYTEKVGMGLGTRRLTITIHLYMN